jgi:putative membrane protein insertion efficiency factor
LQTEKQMQSFDRPPTAEELMNIYMESEKNDPRSVFYQRVLVRPKVRLWILPAVLAGLALCFLAAMQITCSGLWALRITALLCCVLAICFSKQILVYMIKLYQAYAPASTRNRCRYEPSCSQYMLLALDKYGFWKGLRKGLRRWHGCKPPAGGYDMP